MECEGIIDILKRIYNAIDLNHIVLYDSAGAMQVYCFLLFLYKSFFTVIIWYEFE